MENKTINVFNTYNQALTKGDFSGAFETMSDDIKWHQPGKNSLSGEINGKKELMEHLGKFAERSNGTFSIKTNWVSSNDNLVVE